MIKKLRRKFILISMISVFFVLVVTIGAINISNYVVVENESQQVLTAVIEEGPREQFVPGQKEDQRKQDLRQEHFFVASFNVDGTINQIDNRQMFILSQEECSELAMKVYNNELKGGKYGNFRYKKAKKEDGTTNVGFVDIKERIDSANKFLLLSSLISIGAYVALIALIMLASKIAFKSSEEAYKKQKRFITNASHELKTPLTVISADMDIIEMDHGKNEWSESIRDQIKRLTEMTNQLVTLSKLEEEDPSKFPFADFSVNEVAKKAVDAFTPSFKKEGIKFAYNSSGNITMYGSQYLIDQLIYIFLDNSLKYTGGEIKSSYFTISENNKGKVEFRFSNTMSKDDEVDVKQMMERFYRSPSNKKEGSGVGLSIAQEIINLHKGKSPLIKTIKRFVSSLHLTKDYGLKFIL